MNSGQQSADYRYTAGQVYRHHKGRHYRVLSLATHTETGEQLVVYQALYGERGVWARPQSMFEETVVLTEDRRVPRFVMVDRHDPAHEGTTPSPGRPSRDPEKEI